MRFDVYDARGSLLGALAASIHLLPWVPPVVRGDALHAVVLDPLDVPYVMRGRIATEPSR